MKMYFVHEDAMFSADVINNAPKGWRVDVNSRVDIVGRTHYIPAFMQAYRYDGFATEQEAMDSILGRLRTRLAGARERVALLEEQIASLERG